MFGKIRTIAGTSLYITYTDIGALVLMLLAPVSLSLVIGLAFGEGDNAIDLGTSTLVVVNQDETQTIEGAPGSPPQEINWGDQVYVNVLIDNVSPELDELIDATLSTDINRAREQVEEGDYDALLIIPPDYTANVLDPNAQGRIEFFYNPADEVASSVLRSVVDQLTAQINTGQVAQMVLVGAEQPFLIQEGIAQGQSPETIGSAADAVLTTIFTEGVPGLVTINAVNIEGEEQSFDSLQYFAPSMAILFMTFAMATGMRGILEESRTWTLQRLMTTPTPRWAYMAGKMMGTLASGMVQMVLLIFITTAVALVLGRDTAVWGSNYFALLIVSLAVVLAASALGMMLTALARTERQADSVSTAVILVMAVVGGTFIPVDSNPVLDALSNLSLNRWGIEAFTTLSDDGGLDDVLTSLAALLGMTVIFFSAALWGFSQRKDL